MAISDDTLASGNALLDPVDLFGGQANRAASAIQLELSDLALKLQKEFFEVLNTDSQPVRTTRDFAIGQINRLAAGGNTPIDPSTSFAKDQSRRNIRTAAAAQGKLNSGGRLIAEQDANAGITSGAVNTANNRLLNLAGFETGDLLGNTSLIQSNINSQSNQLQNIGAVQAAGIMGQSNAQMNALNQGMGALGYFDGRGGGQAGNNRPANYGGYGGYGNYVGY